MTLDKIKSFFKNIGARVPVLQLGKSFGMKWPNLLGLRLKGQGIL